MTLTFKAYGTWTITMASNTQSDYLVNNVNEL